MNILHGFSREAFPFIVSHVASLYANWRIKPTTDELRSYNQTDRVLLTFDDFADEIRIQEILAILKKEGIRAVFFLIGDKAKQNPRIVEEIKRAGHWVGNHTKTHANLLTLSDQQVRGEILGGSSSTLLRPPYGKYDKRIRNIAKSLGYKICYWNVDSDDWQGIPKEDIISRVVNKIGPGSCVLLHLNGENTLSALPDLIAGIKQKGLEFCSTGKEIFYE